METLPERLNVPTFLHMETLVSGQLELGYTHQLINIKIFREEKFYYALVDKFFNNRQNNVEFDINGIKNKTNRKSMATIRALANIIEISNLPNSDFWSDFNYYVNSIVEKTETFEMLYSDIKRFKDQIIQEKNSIKPTKKQLFDELKKIDNSPNMEIIVNDLEGTYIKAITENIILHEDEHDIDLELGRFEIRLKIPEMSFKILSLDPNPSINDEYTHPHVSGTVLCQGDAEPVINIAKRELRILDILNTIHTTLKTYNPNSPYVPIHKWHSDCSCVECGNPINSQDDDVYRCERCEQYLCEHCRYEYSGCCDSCKTTFCSGCVDDGHLHSCDYCDQYYCDSCSTPCENCGDVICDSCVTDCSVCSSSVCSECMEQCAICEKYLCKNCLKECEDCGELVCEDCVENCVKCEDLFCKNCLESSICRECEEEEEDE